MKQKTVMMKLIDKLMRMPDSHIKNYLALIQDDLIEKEREQIMDAYKDGYHDGCNITQDFKKDYYNETYKQD